MTRNLEDCNWSQDERVMCDGRPAHAWAAEILMAREREPDQARAEQVWRQRFAELRLVEYAVQEQMDTLDLIFRVRRFPAITTVDHVTAMAMHPEKFVTDIQPIPIPSGRQEEQL